MDMSHKMRWVWAIVAIGELALLLLALSFQETAVPHGEEPGEPRLQVIASFFPYAQLAQGVAGDSADVTTLVPAGVEPHDFEPTPRDIEKLYQADVFILNGAGIDAWAEKLAPDLTKRGVRVVRMADLIHLMPAQSEHGQTHAEEQENEHAEETGEQHEEEGHETLVFDPHFWLDPVLAIAQVEHLSQVFSEVDPEHERAYRARGAETKAELEALHEEYTAGLRSCRLRTVVTAHDAFTYLAKRYTLEVVSIAGLSPNAEPSPKRLVEIATLVRKENIKYIFFETLSSPELSQTLARETGVETLVFHPIEGAVMGENGLPETYFSLMRQNLTHLRIALECL